VDFFNGVRIGRPVFKEIQINSTTEAVFECIYSRPFSFFLDSGMDRYKLGRYSFMGYNPFLILKSKGKHIELVIKGKIHTITGNPFHILDCIIKHYKVQTDMVTPPFIGGGVGYFAYDLCHFIENLPATVTDDLKLPDCYFCFYNRVLAYDHLEEKWYLSLIDFDSDQNNRSEKALGKQIRESEEELLAEIQKAKGHEFNPVNGQKIKPVLVSNFTKEDYLRAVKKAKEYIYAGDIYQVNLSQRFHTKLPMKSFQLFKKLRSINPAPFACYLNLDGLTIVSSSPERFLKLQLHRPPKGMFPWRFNNRGPKDPGHGDC
jgi:para-aminobenzoate synthetase component 1